MMDPDRRSALAVHDLLSPAQRDVSGSASLENDVRVLGQPRQLAHSCGLGPGLYSITAVSDSSPLTEERGRNWEAVDLDEKWKTV
jgi:hypothetical protein